MLRRFLDLLCPPLCPLCHERFVALDDVPFGTALPPCEDCSKRIATPAGMFCRRCGGKHFQRNREGNGCRRCGSARFRFQRAIALGEYELELRRIVLRMKTERSGASARTMTSLLVRCRKESIREAAPDRIVSVPIHPRRRWERGVDAPALMAVELGRMMRVPVVSGALRRIRETDLQYTLSNRDRVRNVEDAFRLERKGRRLLPEKNVLLVDDILTTGATCNEITKVLFESGVRSVTVCVLARAEGTYNPLDRGVRPH